MDKPIEITYYTSFAIHDLLLLGKQWKAARPQSARQIGSLVDLMRRGVKFLLPNCAELIDKKVHRRGAPGAAAPALPGHHI